MRHPLLFLALLALLASTACAHPKPGAHADVRISIDDQHVRFTVLMNILFADQIVNVPRASRDDVTQEESEPLRLAIAEYFGGSKPGPITTLVDNPNLVRIDGLPVAPIIKDLRIIHPEPESRPGFEQNFALLLPQIYAVIEYPCKTPPKSVSMVWGSYPRDFAALERDLAPINDIEAVLTAKSELSLITFKKTEPEYVWHAPASRESPLASLPAIAPPKPTSIPVLSIAIATIALLWIPSSRALRVSPGRTAAVTLACLACAALTLPFGRITRTPPPLKLDDSQVLATFTPLHANVYRAFDYENESDIYDALANSVDGPLLDTVYNDIYRSLILQEEGGALARVKSVNAVETRVLSPQPALDRFTIYNKWQVEGVVYHWGHSHSRTNEYAAEYTIANAPQGWRIVALKPLEQRRIESDIQAQSPASANAPALTPDQPDATPPNTTTWQPNR